MAIAQPLYHLTCKETPFTWMPECEEAFHQLKHQVPVLAYPLFGKENDVSGVESSAVLSQKQEDSMICPITFASCTCSLMNATMSFLR